jgi:ribonuclease G
MSKELVVSSNRHETRVAILEDDQVVEVYHQRENEYSLAGSIHKGKVTRVLPGMQSAFVDIGLDRDAFLYVSDFFEDNEEYDQIVTSVEEKVLKLERGGQGGGSVPLPQEIPAPVADAVPPAERETAPVPTGAPAALAMPPQAVTPAAGGPPSGPPDYHRDEHDRRGRRGRRRRNPKDRRGLPESKFYSPGPGTSSGVAAPPSPARTHESGAPEIAPEAPAPGSDDFLVLPGESLAKYFGSASLESATSEEPAAEDRIAEQVEEETSETTSDVAQQPPPEPQPELAAAVEEVAVAAAPPVESAPAELEHSEEPVTAAPEELSEAAVEAAPEAEEAETAEDVEVIPGDAAAAEAVEAAGEEAALEAEAASEDLVAAEASAVPVPEGPEPARIPTSLTATLREQGPRYLHRVSRRMRRRGRDRDGREGREGRPQGAPAAAEPVRAPQPEAGRAEQRTVSGPRSGDGRPERSGSPSIADLLREGQEIIVQIAKEPLGQKGARITSHIALPGRFLVYMPTVEHVGVSRKIPSDDERARLKRILQTNKVGIPGGYIVRTAGEGRSEEELRADMLFLYNLWLDMRQRAERRPAPALIHHDLNVVERVLRDQLTSAFKSIWVDNEEAYESVLRFVERFQPALVSRVKLYTRPNPIFDEFGVTAELEKALRPKVWLKSGGYIVINQTEALVAIDVNTGKYVGKSNRLEDTIVKTNTDAIKEIVRQIRLRDLGGIIVVDFIDMDERKNRQKVMQALEEAMRSDRAPYKILQFNDFGLVAITRKRVKQSLERTLCTPCPYCEGAGYVKSPQTMVGEILQEAQKLAKAIEGKDVVLRVAPEVARLLKSHQNSYLQEIEEVLGRTVIVKSDNQLHQEKFDLA